MGLTDNNRDRDTPAFTKRVGYWKLLVPPMKVRGLGASPLKLAPEKSNPGFCTAATGVLDTSKHGVSNAGSGEQ
jgi:hypothetical protein